MSSEGERLIAFEAAMRELGTLQGVAARYVPLRRDAEALLGELMDLGRTLRRATRRGVFTDDVVEEAAARVRRLRDGWQCRLAELHSSAPYRGALAAYAAGDQQRLGELLPAIFAGLEPAAAAPPLYQAVVLTTRRRTAGSPFRPPAGVAEEVEQVRREGLRPRVRAGDWWDTDFPALSFASELEAIDAPVALSVDTLPRSVVLLREGDAVVSFTTCLRAECSVVLAESSDDSWYEAAEGSYAAYRDALAHELGRRGVAVHRRPAWS
jgi:hypothetical protein